MWLILSILFLLPIIAIASCRIGYNIAVWEKRISMFRRVSYCIAKMMGEDQRFDIAKVDSPLKLLMDLNSDLRMDLVLLLVKATEDEILSHTSVYTSVGKDTIVTSI
jgi:hypothetical protein